MQVRKKIHSVRNEKIFSPWAVTENGAGKISMKKIKNTSYLKSYYDSTQAPPCSVRIVLNKIERPVIKEEKKKKGLYALGSN